MRRTLTSAGMAVLLSTSTSWPPHEALAGPIHEAAKAGDAEQVEQLIAGGAEVDERDQARMTPLHWAADGHLDVARVLISKGADVNAADFAGGSALLVATYYGHEAIAELLISAGADVNHVNSDGETPLDHATRMGLTRTIELLEQAGAECGTHPVSC